MSKWQLTENQKAFIQYIKEQKNFDLTESVQNFKGNTDKCFLTEFWGDAFLAFINGRLYQQEQKQINELELKLAVNRKRGNAQVVSKSEVRLIEKSQRLEEAILGHIEELKSLVDSDVFDENFFYKIKSHFEEAVEGSQND